MPHPIEILHGGHYEQIYNQLPTVARNLEEVRIYNNGVVNLSRHHIIPYNTLRDFWNMLVTQNMIGLARPLLEAIHKNVKNYTITLDQDQRITVRAVIKSIINGDREFDNTAWEYFARVYLWLPGNIFIGPFSDIRQDDPGGDFEGKAGPIVGSRHLSMWTAYNRMTMYVDGNLHKNEYAQEAIKRLVEIAPINNLIPLNRLNWRRGKQAQHHPFRVYFIVADARIHAASIYVTDMAIHDGNFPEQHTGEDASVRVGPINEIKIDDDTTITVTVVERYNDFIHESGEARNISFTKLANWAEKEFNAQIPEELKTVKIIFLQADVRTSPQERTIQLSAAIEFQLGGTTVDMFTDLACTRTNNNATDQSRTEFFLKVSIGVPVGADGDNCLWFDGTVQRGNSKKLALPTPP
ncbi:MAG: hypothetical protein ACRDRU_30185 [Pseudonocardiaceae bacterium]